MGLMLSLTSSLAVLFGPIIVPGSVLAEPPAEAAAKAAPEPVAVADPVRVGGDMEVKVEPNGPFWKSGQVLTDEHLPAGYPRPTPPSAIEIKEYPAVRRAVVNMKAAPGRGRDFAFFPLFNHITKRGIAMTSPVEMDVPGFKAGDPDSATRDLKEQEGWSMAFLYRTADLGPTGKDGVVEVVDQPAMTVLSIGIQGDYWPGDLPAVMAKLETWLAGQSQWKAAGGARIMGYNGPNIPATRRWGEVQLPIVKAETQEGAAPVKDAPAGSASPATGG